MYVGAQEEKIRQDMVLVARRMHDRGFISGYDGNISVRTGQDRLLCTPSGRNKAFIEATDIVVLDMQGKLLRGKSEPSSEVRMHLAVYKERPEAGCVVHAHPPHAVACTLAGISLAVPQVPETAFILGSVPTAAYATPGTDEVPESIRPFVKSAEAILLARHGAVTVGRDLSEAYDRMEALEHVARVLFLARNLGDLTPLSPAEVARLKESVTSRGIPWRYPESAALPANLVDVIVERVVHKLSRS
jgi:L-fuculose-phosphate aldolase